MLGGREGTSRGLGGGPLPYGPLSGEGANVSLFGFGDVERSPRLGRGGTLGVSSCEAGAAVFWARVGRGGIDGGALMVGIVECQVCGGMVEEIEYAIEVQLEIDDEQE